MNPCKEICSGCFYWNEYFNECMDLMGNLGICNTLLQAAYPDDNVPVPAGCVEPPEDCSVFGFHD